MTSPGEFTAGDVLQASDMNALPAGVLMYVETEADFTLNTSFSDIINGSFTVPSSRKILLTGFIPNLQSFSTTAVSVMYLNSASASSPGTYYNAAYETASSGQQHFLIAQRVVTFTAGTYSLYMYGTRTSGTAQINNGSAVRRTFISAQDLGAA